MKIYPECQTPVFVIQAIIFYFIEIVQLLSAESE